MIANLGFDPEIAEAVNELRARKLERKQMTPWGGSQRRLKPRHCITTTLRLCPRQRAKRLKTSGG